MGEFGAFGVDAGGEVGVECADCLVGAGEDVVWDLGGVSWCVCERMKGRRYANGRRHGHSRMWCARIESVLGVDTGRKGNVLDNSKDSKESKAFNSSCLTGILGIGDAGVGAEVGQVHSAAGVGMSVNVVALAVAVGSSSSFVSVM